MNTTIEIDKELEELFWLLEDQITEIKRKTDKATWRIGTTLEKKNDQKRVDQTWETVWGEQGLDKLSTLLFAESGLLEKQLQKFKEKSVK